MIKLKELLEESADTPKPYMYSSTGFGCHVCEYYYKNSDGKHMCKNKNYQQLMGTEELVDYNKQPIKDPSKWCSNWFEPNK